MSDLASGRYPDSEEEWMLDGAPVPPYRRNMSRRDITGVFTPSTSQAYIYVVPVVVQAGDIIGAVSFGVKTAATGTSTHSWVAVYNGVLAGAALLAQSADVTSGYALGANTIDLASVVSNIGTVGTPQGPSTPAIVAQGPAVWGVCLYNSSGTNGPVIDGMTVSTAVTGEVLHTGQVPMISSAAQSATATAPSVLPTMTVGGGSATGIPYVLLSRS